MDTITLEASYRARSHDADDEQLLRDIFGPITAVRLRPLRLPEAGGSFELWLLFSFFGSNVASALIGEATSATRKKITAGIRTFFEHKVSKDQPPDMTVTFSYDDVEIRILSLGREELDLLGEMTEIVRDHLQSAGLRLHTPTVLVIGMARDEEASVEWHEPNAGNSLEPDRRFWAVSVAGHGQLTHIYDADTGLLSECVIR